MEQIYRVEYQIIFVQSFLQMKQGASDWVCVGCTNLNYSFRKVCNRCRTVTREENQNYLHQYMQHAYYQHSYPTTNTDNQQNYARSHQATQSADFSLEDASGAMHRKQSVSSEQSDLAERRSVDWGSSESEGMFMSLIENAWEGLYCRDDPSEFRTEEQIENGCSEQNEGEGEDVLNTFDFTFI